jgi:hypothetical protein
MIASLLDKLGGKLSPGRLYLTLWSYSYGDGFVEVPDPAQVALEAGYSASRAERTVAERMQQLEEFGFLRVARLGTRAVGYVLLVDPHAAVFRLRSRFPEKVDESWWSMFEARCRKAGLEPPKADVLTSAGG